MHRQNSPAGWAYSDSIAWWCLRSTARTAANCRARSTGVLYVQSTRKPWPQTEQRMSLPVFETLHTVFMALLPPACTLRAPAVTSYVQTLRPGVELRRYLAGAQLYNFGIGLGL